MVHVFAEFRWEATLDAAVARSCEEDKPLLLDLFAPG